LVYSITSQRSFEDLDSIRQGIVRHKNNSTNIPMVLVGNKSDLAKKREVDTKDGKEAASEYGCHFIESSAKNDINIQEIFHSLIDQLWEKGVPLTEQRKKKTANGGLLI